MGPTAILPMGLPRPIHIGRTPFAWSLGRPLAFVGPWPLGFVCWRVGRGKSGGPPRGELAVDYLVALQNKSAYVEGCLGSVREHVGKSRTDRKKTLRGVGLWIIGVDGTEKVHPGLA